MLQIDLTDGKTFISGLEFSEHLSSFSINVAPGTKVLLRNTIKVIQGILSLGPQNIAIYSGGGHVQNLYEKWETQRTLAKYGGRKNNELKDSPPPWISFGNKIKSISNADDKNKSSGKSLTKETKELSKEETEFLAMRNAAIADAATKGEILFSLFFIYKIFH